MARYRLLITLAIVSLAFAAYGDQPVFAPRDPSAARKDFSNVDPSTAIDALNLGTMATEAKTDYVSTGTEALDLRLDGSRAMTGSLKFSGDYGILQSTDNDLDSGFTYIAGGGGTGITRGGTIYVLGNEYPSQGGQVQFYAGNVETGHIIFRTGNSSERARLTYGGNVLIGTTTDDGTNKLQVNGSVAISSFMQLASPTAIPTAAAGRIYFNGTEAKFKKCLNGSTWVDM